jgi:NAD(P)-dependent dehydrogenase (short-subunit alcohol dehydrogenase family)
MSAQNRSRVALVTGGSRGIGRAVVEALLEDGWLVYFCGRTQGSVAEAEVELRARFGNAVAGRAADVRQEASVKALVDEALQRSGRIDCLVNNAGVGIFAPVHELSGEAWREVIETNLSGAFYAIRASAPAMRKQGSGWIFNIASLAARNPSPRAPPTTPASSAWWVCRRRRCSTCATMAFASLRSCPAASTPSSEWTAAIPTATGC